MGEKICDIGQLNIKGNYYIVELNAAGGHENEIHIQNKDIRIALPENDFIKIANHILLAKEKLKVLKEKE
jgi:hypothetical protein